MDYTPHGLETILGNTEGGEEDLTCLNDTVITSCPSDSLRGLSPGYNNTMRIFEEVGKQP